MSEAVLGPKSAKYRVFCGYTWKTPVYLENTWVSCRFPQFCPRFCPRPALRLRETREFPEGNSRETEWSTKHPLVSLETSGNAKCWGPSGFPLGCRKLSYRPTSNAHLPFPPVCWRRAVLPSLPWVVCFLSFWRALALTQVHHGSRLNDSREDGEALSSVLRAACTRPPSLAAGKLIHNLLCDGRVKND